MKQTTTNTLLHTISILVLFVGAAGSLLFMFSVGHNMNIILLLITFAVWILSPFIALTLALFLSTKWSVRARRTVYLLILILTIVSLIGYSGIISLHDTRPAFVFLVIPLIAWILIGTVIPIARRSFPVPPKDSSE